MYTPIFDSLKRVKVPQSLCLSGVGAFVVYNVKCVFDHRGTGIIYARYLFVDTDKMDQLSSDDRYVRNGIDDLYDRDPA